MRNCVLSRLNNAVSADDGQYLRPGIESNKEGRENFHHGFSRTEGRKESVYVDTRGRRSEFVGLPKFFFFTQPRCSPPAAVWLLKQSTRREPSACRFVFRLAANYKWMKARGQRKTHTHKNGAPFSWPTPRIDVCNSEKRKVGSKNPILPDETRLLRRDFLGDWAKTKKQKKMAAVGGWDKKQEKRANGRVVCMAKWIRR